MFLSQFRKKNFVGNFEMSFHFIMKITSELKMKKKSEKRKENFNDCLRVNYQVIYDVEKRIFN